MVGKTLICLRDRDEREAKEKLEVEDLKELLQVGSGLSPGCV